MRLSAVCLLNAALALSACRSTAPESESAITASPSSGSPAQAVATAAGSGGAGRVAAVAGAPAAAAAVAGKGAQGAAAVAGSPATGAAGGAQAQASAAGRGTGGVTGAIAGAAAGAAAAGAAGTAAAGSGACDRACLLEVMKAYTDALIAQDPSKLPVASDLKYTENGVTAKLGESAWKEAMSVVADTTLTFADPVEGQVASQFVYAAAGSTQKIYQVRLKVVEHAIKEIESMVVKSGDQFFNPAGMKPEAVYSQMIDPAKRTTRDQLRATTELYLGYLEGKKTAAEVPFDMSCKRYENGTVTADGLSSFQLQSWNFQVTHRILVLDEEAGITWGMFPFQQTETALVVGEAFKIIDGKIMMIQAVMTNMPTKAWN
jgi:hypothetical protein